nr:FAD-binding oxidoreductase [Microbacterium bovistercoris]
MTLLTSDEAAQPLRDALGTRVLFAADAGYDAARTAWNLAVDQRPFAVALPETEAEVAAVVAAATASGLRIAPQSTGHAAGTLRGADLSGTVIVSLRGLRGVDVDPAARTATVRGSTAWHDLLPVAAEHGLTGLHGSAADISVIGYTLTGGISFYGRRHGLATNTVRAARVVTADGSILTASATENPDLFWALRGGAGAFGVVVELEIDLLPIADVFAGMLLWDGARAVEVAQAWAQWTASAPESATTALRIMHFPPIPELPPFLSGRSVVIVDGAILDTDAAAAAILQPLRALAPELDTFARMPAPGLVDVHMDPPEPAGAVQDHAMLAALDAPAVDAFVSAAFTARPMVSEIRHLGGALGRRPADAGAVGAVIGEHLLSAVQLVPVPDTLPAATAAVRGVVGALSEWHGPGLALTFVDDDRDPAGGFGESAARLAELKLRYDPEDVFLAAHRVR